MEKVNLPETMTRPRTTIRGIDSTNTCSIWSGNNHFSRPPSNPDACQRIPTMLHTLLKLWKIYRLYLTTFVRNTHKRCKRSNLLFGGLIDDVGSFLHGSRLHCCWSLGFPASSQFELLTPSRIQRTSLVCTPVPHVTEHWKNRLGIYNEIYIGIYISGSRKVTVLVRP